MSVAVALALGLSVVPATQAGPNDQLEVATERHVDSPKIFWNEQNNNFELKSEFGGATRPIEQTVNWFGKGDGQQYFFEVGDDPRLEFLGNQGDVLYYGPDAGASGYPIWIGFGADIGIPAKDFRDSSFTLDLVEFDGPGHMELFNYSDVDFPLRRLLSSHDPNRRSTWIKPGLHTHNKTTFTKPGNYTLTYRASTRLLDGTLVESAPQKVVWQVGGTKPSTQGLGDVRAAYDGAATATRAAGTPTFSVGPVQTGSHLSELTLDTGNPSDSGHAVFFIDGYYLAEVPVSGGVGTWTELLGSQAANLQAVFIPDSGSASPKWVSAPVTYTTGDTATETEESGAFPKPNSTDPASVAADQNIQVSDLDVQVSTKPHENGMNMVEISAVPADDRLSFRVVGGYYDSEDATEPSCEVDFVSTPTNRSSIETRDTCDAEATVLKLRMVPTAGPDVSAAQFSQVVGAAGEADGQTGFVRSGSAVPTSASPATSTTAPSTSTSVPKTSAPETAEPVTPTQGRFRLNNGHIDLGPLNIDGGINFALGDDTGIYEPHHVTRNPEDVDIVVGRLAAIDLAKNTKIAELFPFLSNKKQVFVLPQTQRDGLPWPGFSTEHLDGVDGKAVTFEAETVEKPAGAEWYAFTSGNFGGMGEMLLNSTDTNSFERTGRVHLHNNWAFTQPGVYRIKMRAKANDGSFATADRTVTFLVDTPVAPVPAPSTVPATTSQAPTAQPTTKPAPTSSVAPGTSSGPGSSEGGIDTALAIGLGLTGLAITPAIVKALQPSSPAMSSKPAQGAAAYNNTAHTSAATASRGNTGSAPSAAKSAEAKQANAQQASTKRGMLAATGAQGMLLLGLAMLFAGAGFAVLAMRRLRM